MRPTVTLFAVLLAASLAPAAGCASADSSWVELAGRRFTVEIADNDAERARGLMFRDALADGHGMLFIHDRQEPQAYWMKNTRIALDILYFDDGLRLVSQQRGVPPCSAGNACPSYPSDEPALYVLELNAGEAAKLNVTDGAVLRLGPGIDTSRETAP
jgi:uncharacterized membrane protein (UPF0127 family)